MANVLDRLVVELGLDGEALKSGIEKASKALENFGKNVEASGGSVDQLAAGYSRAGLLMGGVSDEVAKRILEIGTDSQKTALVAGRAFERIRDSASSLGAVLKTAVAPLAAAFAGGKILSTLSETGEALSVLSERTGVSVDRIDAWAKANRDAGGSAEAFQSALEDWTVSQGRSADEFFRLGESVKGMTTEQSAYFLQSMGLSQDAAAVFTKFKDGADEAAKSYAGMAFTQEQADAAREMNVLMRRFTDQAQALGNMLAVTVLPVVNTVLGVLGDGLGFITKHSRAVKLVVAGVAAVIGGAYLQSVLAAVGGFSKLFATIKAGGGIVATFNSILLANPLGAVVAGVVALSVALDDLGAFLDGDSSAFASFLHWVGFSDDQIISFRENLGSFVDAVANIPSAIAGKLSDAWETIKAVGRGFRDRILAPFAELPSLVVGLVRDAFGGISSAAVAAGNSISKGFSDSVNWLRETFRNLGLSIWTWLTDAFDIGGAVKDKVGGAIKSVKSFLGIEDEEEEKQDFSGKEATDETAKTYRRMAVGEDADTERPEEEKETQMDRYRRFMGEFSYLIKEVDPVMQATQAAAVRQAAPQQSITNDMQVSVNTNISGATDPEAVGQSVSVGVSDALAKSRRMLVNAQTGVVQKG